MKKNKEVRMVQRIVKKGHLLDKEILKNIKKLCSKFGVLCLILFGSRAKKEASIKSDIDLAVLFKENDYPLEQEMEFYNSLMNLFQTDHIDLIVLNTASPLLMKEVAVYGVPLYEEKKRVFDRFQIKAIKRYLDSKKFIKLIDQCLEEFLQERGV